MIAIVKSLKASLDRESAREQLRTIAPRDDFRDTSRVVVSAWWEPSLQHIVGPDRRIDNFTKKGK